MRPKHGRVKHGARGDKVEILDQGKVGSSGEMRLDPRKMKSRYLIKVRLGSSKR